MRSLLIACIVLLIPFVGGPSQAESESAEDVRLAAVIDDYAAWYVEEPKEMVRDLLSRIDYQGLGPLLIGGRMWHGASDEERAAFIIAFKKYMKSEERRFVGNLTRNLVVKYRVTGTNRFNDGRHCNVIVYMRVKYDTGQDRHRQWGSLAWILRQYGKRIRICDLTSGGGSLSLLLGLNLDGDTFKEYALFLSRAVANR